VQNYFSPYERESNILSYLKTGTFSWICCLVKSKTQEGISPKTGSTSTFPVTVVENHRVAGGIQYIFTPK